MAINYPGPYSLSFTTTTSDGYVHKTSLNFDSPTPLSVGDDYATINAITRAGGNRLLSTAVDELLDRIGSQYYTGVTFSGIEVWKHVPLSFEKTFITSTTGSVAGLSGATTTKASQATLTFRTQEGGLMKFIMLETIQPYNSQRPYTNLAADEKLIVDHFTSSSNVWLARDTSYPVSFIRMSYGQNESVWRKRFRVS